MNYQKDPDKPNYLLPISIVVAAVIIAGSLFFLKGRNSPAAAVTAASTHPENTLPDVTSSDHILGNINAPVTIVEYADTDCPYCDQFQSSMHQIIDEYGKTDQVAWVYRHFAFHPKAPKEAEATECVAELGGNDKFWQYLDLLFSKKDFTQSPYLGLDPAQLPDLASQVGVNRDSFVQCLASGRYTQKVKDEYNEAIKAGGQGTPFMVIITKNGRIPITSGALPYTQLKQVVQLLLNETPQ